MFLVKGSDDSSSSESEGYPVRAMFHITPCPVYIANVIYKTVNLAYNVPVGTSVFCPLYTKSVLRVYRTVSVIRIYRTLSVIDINRTLKADNHDTSTLLTELHVFQTPCMHMDRERNVLFNDALNTFYLRLYGVRHMVKDHSDSEKGYSYRARVLLYAPSHRQDNTYHGIC